MKRIAVVLAASLGLSLGAMAFVSPAFAAAHSRTFHIHNGTDTFIDQFPCVGGKYQITLTFNAVAHITKVGPHLVHVTFTQTGTLDAVTHDPTSPSFTGHFTQWNGFNSNPHNVSGTFTFSVHAVGSDGSHVTFHEVAHFNVSASGIENSFDKPTCS